MNTSEEYQFIYFDDNSTTSVENDEDSLLSNGVTVTQVLLCLLFCLGLLGNTTVLWILLRYIKLRTMTDICLLNLALSDLIVALSLPLWAYNSQNVTSCKIITGVYQLGFYSGTLFVTLMSVDRYLAIVHAVAAMRARTLRCGITASITIWFISFIMATPQVIFANIEMDTDCNSSQRCQPLYPDDRQRFWKSLRNFSENTVSLFLCLPIMVFCYVKILFVLSNLRNSKKDRAVKLIFIIVCVFVVCWVPYNVIVFLKTLQLFDILNTPQASRAIDSVMGYSEIIALSHCCLNPVIYAFVGEKFRRSLRILLTRYSCGLHQSRGTSSYRDTTEKETSNTPVKSDY